MLVKKLRRDGIKIRQNGHQLTCGLFIFGRQGLVREEKE
jgi:hypothetical protein